MDISAFFSNATQLVYRYIEGLSDEEVDRVDSDRLAQEMLRQFAVPAPVILGESLRREELRGGYGHGAVIQFVLQPEQNLGQALKLRPAAHDPSEPPMSLELNTVYVHTSSDEASIEQALHKVRAGLRRRSVEIEPKRAELMAWAHHRIFERKEALRASDAHFAQIADNLGLELTKRSDPRAQAIDVSVRRTIEVARTPPSGTADSAQRHLTVPQARMIAEEIARVGRQFEVVPNTYRKLQEADLRNITVGLLNAVFDVGGVAVGEAFQGNGKTDVLLVIGPGAVYAAEMKFWGGKVRYLRALEQLFGYLAVRQGHAALVTYVRDTSLTAATSAAHEAVRTHSTTLSTGEVSDGRFTSDHVSLLDSSRQVVVEHLLFSLATTSPRQDPT